MLNDTQQMIDGLNKSIREKLGKPPFPELKPDWKGHITLGIDEKGREFGFKDDYPKNIISIGRPGQGKSYDAIYIASQLKEKATIIFLEAGGKRAFRKDLLRIWDDILPLSYEDGTIKTNFLQSPPGVPHADWDQTFSSVFCQSQNLPISGTAHLISTSVQELRNSFKDKEINLFDLRDSIRTKKANRRSTEAKYIEVADNRLSDICDILKNSIDVSEGYNFAQLINSPFIKVIECSGRPDLYDLEATDFIFRTLKYQEYLPPKERRNIIFIIDEAHHLCGPQKEHVSATGGISNLFTYMANGRAYNSSFYLITQAIKRIHPSVPSLCHIEKMFSSDGETYQWFGVNIMGLSYEQKNYLLEHGLAPREVVVKADMNPAVLVRIPDISHMFREIDYVEAQNRIEEYLKGFEWKPRDPEIQKLINANSEKREDKENILLSRLCNKPLDIKSEHQNALGMNATLFTKLVDRLETQEILRSVTIQSGNPGKQPQILELLPRGIEEVKRMGLKPSSTGKGGAAHNKYLVMIEEILRKDGYQTRREYLFPGPGLFVDIFAWKTGESIAVEVELSDTGHLIDRLRKLTEANLVNKIYAFSDSKEIIAKSNRLLKRREVVFMTVQEFFREKRK